MTQDTIIEVMQAQAAQIGAIFAVEKERMQAVWDVMHNEARQINHSMNGGADRRKKNRRQ